MPVDAYSSTLGEKLTILVEKNQRILAAKANLEKAKEEAKASWSAWHPNLSVTSSIGHEEQNKPSGTDSTDMVPRIVELGITQKVWDFGASNSAIRTAELTVEKAQLELEKSEILLLLEAMQAHFDLILAHTKLILSSEIEGYLKQQLDYEVDRLKNGDGLKADVLNARILFSQSKATRVDEEEVLVQALNNYEYTFGFKAAEPKNLSNPRLPLELLPENIEEIVAQTKKIDQFIAISRIESQLARENTRATRASQFFPTIEASAQSILKEDEGGTVGSKQERIVKLEATYNFSLGFTAINTLRAAKQDHVSKHSTSKDTDSSRVRDVQSAYSSYQAYLNGIKSWDEAIANIQEKIDLISEEVDSGDRAVSELYSAQKELVDAVKKKLDVETKMKKTVFTMLAYVGKLNANVVD
jgi:outer membrane protein